MPGEKYRRLQRIKGIEVEFNSVRVCVDYVLRELGTAEIATKLKLRFRDVASANNKLEATYLIRIFAEFETTLRDFYRPFEKTDKNLRMVAVINRVGAVCRVPSTTIQATHEARTYRNQLLHGRGTAADSVTLTEARRAVCAFLSCLPSDW